jgi:hypothetical protein
MRTVARAMEEIGGGGSGHMALGLDQIGEDEYGGI